MPSLTSEFQFSVADYELLTPEGLKRNNSSHMMVTIERINEFGILPKASCTVLLAQYCTG